MLKGKYLATALVIIALTAVILTAMGRVFTCSCGYVRPWSSDINGPENSQQLSDPYSLTHVIHGLGFYALLHFIAPSVSLPARALISVGLEGGWEIIENTDATINRYRSETLSYGYFGDSVVNSISDIVMMLVGFYFARRFKLWPSIILFLAIEIGLALLIRDGLLINVIMLLYPLQAIKNWQLGL